ncbi:GNAT family N-acetyltransferase [Halomarina salina]|uniref:GNAT family N-acetyltransferase n=1 Tax=Halomarina salina TaxID=1872699 RepID=A0ABD5RP33_9EURY|nr:GNAT family N-acetyltransferase [Halomarina salina]
MDSTYSLHHRVPTADELAHLRELNEMGARSMAGLRRGLPNSLFGVVVTTSEEGAEVVVGTGRVVGDGASVFHVCDMVVHPDHQSEGLGTRIMDALMAYIEEAASLDAYVNLLADVEGFYERWGFERTAPVSRGMFLRTE